MPTVGNVITITDIAKTWDPDGKPAKIVEVLNENNEMLKDIPWVEGNMEVGHRHTVRSGLPEPTWRLLNYGTQPTKGRTVQRDDMCGMLEAVCDIDAKSVKLNGNKESFRWSQDKAHIEGMGQGLAEKLVYGNQDTDPEQITGFAPRYSVGSLTGKTKTIADNVLDGGGVGSDNTSVWLIAWGVDKIFGIYPKGSKAGLESEDRGRIDKTDANGGVYRVYRNYYSWDCGLAIGDWRYAVRLANIDVSDLTTDASAGANLIELMVRMVHRLPNKIGKLVYYCNDTVAEYLDLQTLNSKNMRVSYGKDQYGSEVLKFRNLPVREMEKIMDTESVVPFS